MYEPGVHVAAPRPLLSGAWYTHTGFGYRFGYGGIAIDVAARGERRVSCVEWRRMSLLCKVPICLEGLSAVLLDDEGEVHREVIGAKDAVSTEGGFVVLFQRGLLPAPDVRRCHRSLISPFKIKVGGSTANVPWANFSWVRCKDENMTCRAACDQCERDDCMTCFENLTADDVMVVWIHSESGERVYQWYVAFEHKRKVLTRVPSHFFTSIVKNSSIAGFCKCGRCRHPLYDMINTRSRGRADTFDRRAVAYFSEFHKRVLESKRSTGCGSAACPDAQSTQTEFVEDTCSVCLEETFVASSCVQERCTMNVCSECIVKTRGLCPLCDRSKLSKNVGFLCHSCNNAAPLGEYGHRCNGCDKTTLCTHCFKNFCMCVDCERDITRTANTKRGRDVGH